MDKRLDEALAKIEHLQAENERLEALVYRLRTSERKARQSSLTPAEQVTLGQWGRIDRIVHKRIYMWRKERADFPQPCATFLDTERPLYDLDALRAWKRAEDERQEAHRARQLEKRLEESRWFRETYVNECS